MTNAEINKTVTEIKELAHFIEELTAEMEGKKDELKAFMSDIEELNTDIYKLTYKAVESERLDTKSLKAELPEIAKKYMVTSTTKRFTIK